MVEYARFYSFYNTLVIKLARIFIFILLINFSFLFLSIFLMWEIFFYFKIARTVPFKLVKNNNGKNIYDSFTFQALTILVSSFSSIDIIRALVRKPQVKFILEKADILEKDIIFAKIPKDSIENLAFENCKKMNGKYVTTMDIVAAYLLLTENETKVLFNRNLKKEELINILYWAKSSYAKEENPSSFKVKFWGEGIGEAMVSGWTIETGKHILDITAEALGTKPMFFGREEQYKEAIEALNRNKSILLIGEPGSGRRSLVKALAFESFVGELEGNLYHQRFYQVLIDSLLAGVQNEGQLAERINNVIAEISHSGNIIVYIPNFENILGSSSFNTDLSGAIVPYVEKGILRIAASVTPGSFERFVKPKRTLTSAFEIIKFEEPDREIVFKMLLQKTSEIEKKNKISISYKAIEASLNFAEKYSQDSVLPGAGVSLLEDTANTVAMSKRTIVEEQDIVNKVESKTKIAVGVPGKKERELLLRLEDEMSKYIVGQKEAIVEVSEALRRLRAGLNDKKKPISFLFLGPTGVGKTQTAKAISNIYFGGERKMIRFDMSEYSTEEGVKRLLGGIIGSKGLTDEIHEHPFSLVLLDEFEKANFRITDLFLQVLDDGRLTDNLGKTASFADAIIIATSNAASEYIREEMAKGTAIDKTFQKNLLEFLQGKGIFRPEFLNRFDGIIVFKSLTKEEIFQIVVQMLKDFSKTLLEKDIAVSFDEKAISKITQEGFDEQFGARPLHRFIQNNIEDLVAKKMLTNEVKRGGKIQFSVDNANNIAATVS